MSEKPMEQKIDLDALEAALARYHDHTPLDIKSALPALIAELRELRAREAHMRRFAESMADDGHPILMGFAYQVQAILGTHALPMPPAPEAQ